MINVYGPTQAKSTADEKIRDTFYEQLEAQITHINKSVTLFIAGDFNSKIGHDWTNTNCIGRYCRGRRNTNGQQLAEFCETFDLVAANTLFQHRASHRTTWSGQRRNAETGAIVPIYNQIDYILAPRRQLNLIANARSYSGTVTESDHRLVVATTTTPPSFKRKFGQTPPKSQPKLNVNLLASDLNKRFEYQKKLNNKIQHTTTTTNTNNAFERWVKLRMTIKNTANETVGTVRKRKHLHECPHIEQLSNEQHQLRLEIANTTCQIKRPLLKARRKNLLKEIKKQQHENKIADIERRTAEINSLKDGARMFWAVKDLTNSKPKTPVVKNEIGETVAQPEEAAKIVAGHFFKLFFTSSSSPINTRFPPTKGKLITPITTKEVCEATSRLRNGRAIGPDGVPGELLKYGDTPLHTQMAEIYNEMFENGQDLELGHGTLIVLPKPGKPPGLLSSLRPIVLLTTLRKTLSLIVLFRIRPAVEQFLPDSQSGFRQYRSTADVVWAHKWMIARIMKAREELWILGIDMSRAFDTIDRLLLLAELRTIIDEDSWRIVVALLDHTTLQAKIKNALSEPFETNIGAPQGDSLSPVLFTIYLELAMREIRTTCPRPQQDLLIPNEAIYADDTDYISGSKEVLKAIEPVAKTILGNWNLAMNTEKTELTHLIRKDRKEDEAWRNTKKLGTLLGDSEEMRRRKQLAAASFKNLSCLWTGKRNKLSLERKLKLYNAYIIPVLTYNTCTWALTEKELEELEAFRRRQLRRILGVRYPRRISNSKLYTKCNTKELAPDIRGARWRMLGHTLRMADNTPAKKAMLHYFDKTTSSFLGRPRHTLPLVINQDLKMAATNNITGHFNIPSQLKKIEDLRALETLANDRNRWIKLVKCVTDMQVTEPPKSEKRLMPRRNVKQ